MTPKFDAPVTKAEPEFALQPSLVKNEVEFSLQQAAVAASAAAAAAANPGFFHFHKQELDIMAKNHLDLFTINNNNDIEAPKINRDERKREQRCFQVSRNCYLFNHQII